MLNEPTIEKLRALGLGALADALVAQAKLPDVIKLSFDERLAMLVDAESLQRENKRLERALKEAKLKIGQAAIEGIDYAAKRELDRAVVRQLATCRWVNEHHNVVITGATGTGKTYVACALAQQACRKGFRALYRRASRLTDELTLARADGSYARVLTRLARVDVLIIDDWAHAPLRDQERRDLLEILDDRYDTRSTIMTSQLDPKLWHDHIGDPTNADAICDRILHNAHKVRLKGPSRRDPREAEPKKD
jgi:DNA replication protein DnaC